VGKSNAIWRRIGGGKLIFGSPRHCALNVRRSGPWENGGGRATRYQGNDVPPIRKKTKTRRKKKMHIEKEKVFSLYEVDGNGEWGLRKKKRLVRFRQKKRRIVEVGEDKISKPDAEKSLNSGEEQGRDERGGEKKEKVPLAFRRKGGLRVEARSIDPER